MARKARNARELSPWSEAAAAVVRGERAVKRWTLKEASGVSNIPLSTYRKIETGEHTPDVTEMARLCGAYGWTLAEFSDRITERVQRAGGDDPATYNRGSDA